MPTERVIEVPWALMQLPQTGVILDVGSCHATYLNVISQPDRELHCLDTDDCSADMPNDVVFHHESIIGNTLPRTFFDAVLCISTIEHIGLPCYGQTPFTYGDELAVTEIWSLLKPGAPLIATLPAGQSKVMSWYRQYTPTALHQLFQNFDAEFYYWAFNNNRYDPVKESDVELYDYRDHPGAGAGVVAGIVAYRR